MLRRELISSKSSCTGAGDVFNPIRTNNPNKGFALFCISRHLNGDRAWSHIDHGRTERLNNGQDFCSLLSRCRNFHQDNFALQVHKFAKFINSKIGLHRFSFYSITSIFEESSSKAFIFASLSALSALASSSSSRAKICTAR